MASTPNPSSETLSSDNERVAALERLSALSQMNQSDSSMSAPQSEDTPSDSSSDSALTPTKKKRSFWKVLYNIALYGFALAGFGIIGAWAFYQLGGTRNKGAVDENYRYLMSVSEMNDLKGKTLSKEQVNELWMNQFAKLAAFGKFYPENARLILEAAQASNNPMIIDRMIAAASVYADKNDDYQSYMKEMSNFFKKQKQHQNANVIPWMATVEWQALKDAIIKDSALLVKAGLISGVEPRLIASCLVGEQIRLFNSKREMFKKYLGPVKVLSVQSQFSYGVNGIKDFTAAAVEEHLKDPNSVFYMGKHYENILDFETSNHSSERYKRLVDYKNHLYSYIYTGCILHQTMLQWKRAGYDISDRPDILCTLFNVGFSQSHPHADPVCGGSHVTVDGRIYTFGAIGFDFYYSGELAKVLPYWSRHFIEDNGKALTQEEIQAIQGNMSNCNRPEQGLEYRTDSSRSAGPDGVVEPSSSNSQMLSPREAEARSFSNAAGN